MSFLGKCCLGAAALAAVFYLSDNGFLVSSAGASDTSPIPADYLTLYQQAGSTCPHLDWALLAGVGKVETDHGRARLPGVSGGANYAGAKGPMQFLQPTFDSVSRRHADVGSSPYNPKSAVTAAAHYLCDSGVASGDISGGLWAYNHSAAYRSKVLAQARQYRAGAST